ncbi:MAG: Hsp70 family protein [Dermatophilaceae bacterium]
MANSYHLGVDVGASRVHAATARHTASGNERLEACSLSSRGDDMAASMWVSPEGDLEFGAIASAWAGEQPEALVGGLRRRIGTGTPFFVAGHRVLAEEAYARLVAWVVDAVTETEGMPPEGVVVTHPVHWGAHRREGVRRALEAYCRIPVELTPEAEAAAWGAIDQAQAGELWALFDLGRTSLDTAVVRRQEDGWTVLPEAFGTAPVGGIDVDDAMVDSLLPDRPTARRPSRTPSAELRSACVAAKVALSTDTDAVVATQLEPGPSTVRLTRDEFESMIRTLLDQSVGALRQTMTDGGVTAEDLSGVVLAGGSARIPLVTEHLSTALGVPILTEPDPAVVIAMGAARRALRQSTSDLAAELGPGATRDEPLRPDEQVAVLIPFIPPERARLATYAWRLVVASLIVVCAVYLAWAFTSDSAGVFGVGLHAESVVERPRGG